MSEILSGDLPKTSFAARTALRTPATDAISQEGNSCLKQAKMEGKWPKATPKSCWERSTPPSPTGPLPHPWVPCGVEAQNSRNPHIAHQAVFLLRPVAQGAGYRAVKASPACQDRAHTEWMHPLNPFNQSTPYNPSQPLQPNRNRAGVQCQRAKQ